MALVKFARQIWFVDYIIRIKYYRRRGKISQIFSVNCYEQEACIRSEINYYWCKIFRFVRLDADYHDIWNNPRSLGHPPAVYAIPILRDNRFRIRLEDNLVVSDGKS